MHANTHRKTKLYKNPARRAWNSRLDPRHGRKSRKQRARRGHHANAPEVAHTRPVTSCQFAPWPHARLIYRHICVYTHLEAYFQCIAYVRHERRETRAETIRGGCAIGKVIRPRRSRSQRFWSQV